MKTLAWRDMGNPSNTFYIPKLNKDMTLFEPKRNERNIKLLQELKHTGNIAVYLLKGNKTRFLFSKGI